MTNIHTMHTLERPGCATSAHFKQPDTRVQRGRRPTTPVLWTPSGRQKQMAQPHVRYTILSSGPMNTDFTRVCNYANCRIQLASVDGSDIHAISRHKRSRRMDYVGQALGSDACHLVMHCCCFVHAAFAFVMCLQSSPYISIQIQPPA